MSKQVNGYLAEDGTFFETEPECDRYDAERDLSILCDSHEVNFENFMAILNAWHNPIGKYYDADDKCEDHKVGQKAHTNGASDPDQPALFPTEEDRANPARRDKSTPGFLEQQIRGNK
jgi:hypothetical protein